MTAPKLDPAKVIHLGAGWENFQLSYTALKSASVNFSMIGNEKTLKELEDLKDKMRKLGDMISEGYRCEFFKRRLV